MYTPGAVQTAAEINLNERWVTLNDYLFAKYCVGEPSIRFGWAAEHLACLYRDNSETNVNAFTSTNYIHILANQTGIINFKRVLTFSQMGPFKLWMSS